MLNTLMDNKVIIVHDVSVFSVQLMGVTQPQWKGSMLVVSHKPDV